MPPCRRLLPSIFPQLAISISLPLLTSLPAAAVLVAVNQVNYDVIVFEGSFDDHSALFQAPPAGLMPWWGDPSGSLASEFAFQVYDSLGSGSGIGSGPLFAYLQDSGSGTLEGWVQSLTDPNAQDLQTPFSNAAIKYALLNPVPSPLPVLAAITTFSVSRKLRQHLRQLKSQ